MATLPLIELTGDELNFNNKILNDPVLFDCVGTRSARKLHENMLSLKSAQLKIMRGEAQPADMGNMLHMDPVLFRELLNKDYLGRVSEMTALASKISTYVLALNADDFVCMVQFLQPNELEPYRHAENYLQARICMATVTGTIQVMCVSQKREAVS